MSRQVECAKCGASHTLINPGICMLVCSYCRAVLYWDEDHIVRIGRESRVPEEDTRLFLHASGQLPNRRFGVAGHLRYKYGAGTWDEWYLESSDGAELWLSEDERQLRLQKEVPLGDNFPRPQELRVGQTLQVREHTMVVQELGTATLVLCEGQLPYRVLPGETYPYVELATHDGKGFVTLEYDDNGRVHGFIGQSLEHDQLKLDQEREPSNKKIPVGKNITCKNCAANLENPRPDVETLVCAHCGAMLELSAGQLNVLGINAEGFNHGFVLDIGSSGMFDGVRYEVSGRMYYRDLGDYCEPTREYLLYNPQRGYLWLAEYNGHYTCFSATDAIPEDVNALDYTMPRTRVKFDGKNYRKYESGQAQLEYVDGALPWRACVGESHAFTELVDPPYSVAIERTGQELEVFTGQYIKAEEIHRKFNLKKPLPEPQGIAGAQPVAYSPQVKRMMWIGFLAGVINLFLLVGSFKNGRLVYTTQVEAGDYLQGGVTEPFDIPKTRLLSLEVAAQVSNSWVAMEVALVDDATDEVAAEVDGEMAYYEGVEEGESWSEGSNSDSAHFLAPPPGRYRLMYQGAGGTGEDPDPFTRTPVTMSLYTNPSLSRYYLAAAIFALLFPILGLTRQRSFEAARWSEVIEDDDDDDD